MSYHALLNGLMDPNVGYDQQRLAYDGVAYSPAPYHYPQPDHIGAIAPGSPPILSPSPRHYVIDPRPIDPRAQILVPRAGHHVAVSPFGRPIAPRAEPLDYFDAVLQGGLREKGQGLPQATMAQIEVALAVGAAFVLNANAPMPFVFTSLTVNLNAAQFLSNVTFLIGGQPVLSYAGSVDLSRFVAGSFDKRVPPIEVPAGTPIFMSAVVNAAGPAAPNNLYRVSVEGEPLRQALTQASA